MSSILKPLDNSLYTVGKGVLHFYPFANPNDPTSYSKGYRVGDCDSFSLKVETEALERYSNEYSVKTKVLDGITSKTATVSLTVAQMSPVMRAAAVLGEMSNFTQDAVTAATKDLAEVGVYYLGACGITNIDVVLTADQTPAVSGTDYMIDAESGQIEVLTAGLTVTFDAPEITDLFATGIASGKGIRGMMIYRGVNAQGAVSVTHLHDFEMKPSNDRQFISASDIQTVELTGTAYPVAGQPEGFEIGYERDLTTA